jgi:hypothetical protein
MPTVDTSSRRRVRAPVAGVVIGYRADRVWIAGRPRRRVWLLVDQDDGRGITTLNAEAVTWAD